MEPTLEPLAKEIMSLYQTPTGDSTWPFSGLISAPPPGTTGVPSDELLEDARAQLGKLRHNKEVDALLTKMGQLTVELQKVTLIESTVAAILESRGCWDTGSRDRLGDFE